MIIDPKLNKPALLYFEPDAKIYDYRPPNIVGAADPVGILVEVPLHDGPFTPEEREIAVALLQAAIDEKTVEFIYCDEASAAVPTSSEAAGEPWTDPEMAFWAEIDAALIDAARNDETGRTASGRRLKLQKRRPTSTNPNRKSPTRPANTPSPTTGSRGATSASGPRSWHLGPPARSRSSRSWCVS